MSLPSSNFDNTNNPVFGLRACVSEQHLALQTPRGLGLPVCTSATLRQIRFLKLKKQRFLGS